METRFVVLSLLTSIFQIICAITLVIGVVLIINGINADQGVAVANNPFGPAPANPFSQVSGGMEIGGGAVLALYGLTGLVFSGGINVLISIDQNTHSLSESLPAAFAALQKAIAANPRLVTTPTPSLQAVPPVTSAATHPEQKQCATCNSLNDANGRFCEYCGEPLSHD
jgi:hypothetical protein